MSMTREDQIRRVAKPAVFLACLVPLGWILWRVYSGGLSPTGGLGANPIEFLNRYLGDWALRFLLLTLAITPMVKIANLPVLIRFRRMIGLFAFFYAVMHVSSYVVLDHFFDWNTILKDIIKRRYITVGMIILTILTVLAVTSPKAVLKKMGFKKWRKLHRLVYVAAALAPVHFFMMVKSDVREPLIYGSLAALLLGWRVWDRRHRADARPSIRT